MFGTGINSPNLRNTADVIRHILMFSSARVQHFLSHFSTPESSRSLPCLPFPSLQLVIHNLPSSVLQSSGFGSRLFSFWLRSCPLVPPAHHNGRPHRCNILSRPSSRTEVNHPMVSSSGCSSHPRLLLSQIGTLYDSPPTPPFSGILLGLP